MLKSSRISLHFCLASVKHNLQSSSLGGQHLESIRLQRAEEKKTCSKPCKAICLEEKWSERSNINWKVLRNIISV